MRSLSSIFFIFILLFSSLAIARDDVDYFKEKDIIKELINQSLEIYKAGDNLKAKELAGEAYFQHFENMEGPIGRNIGRKGFLMERKFNHLREQYRTKQPLHRIQALIDGLFFDLDEVTPIIQNGFKIKAVATQIDYDQEKAEADARAYQLRQCVEASMMFDSISEQQALAKCEEQQAAEKQRLADEESGKVAKAFRDASQTQNSEDDNLAALQAASAMDAKVAYLYDQISDKFDEAIGLNKEQNYSAAADAIGEARTDLYVNSGLEKAANAIKNINMRVRLRDFGNQIRDGKLDEKAIREQSEALLEELFDVMQKINPESANYEKIIAKGFVDKKQGVDYHIIADQIKDELESILKDYGNEATKTSMSRLQDVYLSIFEESTMEDAIASVNTRLKLDIESQFAKGKTAIKEDKSKEELKAIFDELNAMIERALPEIMDNSPFAVFIAAFGIILREGMEALIIVVAIVSYLMQSGNGDKIKTVYMAILSAVVLSFVIAFAIRFVISNSGQSREILEGVTMLIAVVFLLYVGFWMLNNAKSKDYMQNIMKQTKTSISNGSAQTLWWTVFLSVFREGAETILFYQGLLGRSEGGAGPVLGGLALGFICLIVIYFLLKAGAIKIPFKAFFRVTSIIIFYMAFAFIGQAIIELNAGGLVEPTTISVQGNPIFKSIPWLGLHPYYESLIPQAIMLLLLVVGVLYMQKNSKKETK